MNISAVTHNKGINEWNYSCCKLQLGQDSRAIEAAANAYAIKNWTILFIMYTLSQKMSQGNLLGKIGDSSCLLE